MKFDVQSYQLQRSSGGKIRVFLSLHAAPSLQPVRLYCTGLGCDPNRCQCFLCIYSRAPVRAAVHKAAFGYVLVGGVPGMQLLPKHQKQQPRTFLTRSAFRPQNAGAALLTTALSYPVLVNAVRTGCYSPTPPVTRVKSKVCDPGD